MIQDGSYSKSLDRPLPWEAVMWDREDWPGWGPEFWIQRFSLC